MTEFDQRLFFVTGSLFAFLAFSAGAFGAHALKNKLSPDYLVIFETAVRYQMYHALALIALTCASSLFSSVLLAWAGWSFILGTVIFSGSLYLLVWTGLKWWGAITPIGGVIQLIAWILVILGGVFSK